MTAAVVVVDSIDERLSVIIVVSIEIVVIDDGNDSKIIFFRFDFSTLNLPSALVIFDTKSDGGLS